MLETILERYNENSYIRFPFVEDCSMTGSQGQDTLELGTDVLLDTRAVVLARGAGTLRLYTLEVSQDGSVFIAGFLYEPLEGQPVSVALTVPVGGWDTMGFYSTQVFIDELSLFPVFGPGVPEFARLHRGLWTFEDLRLEPSCLSIRNKHVVTSMTSSTDVVLRGDIKLQPGYNMAVAVSQASNAIRLTAMLGEGLGQPCEKTLDIDGNCGELVYSINGATPDWYGDFLLEAGPGISITADKVNHKIVIKTSHRACAPGCQE